jgi:type VI secretion system protein ImpG
MRAERLLPAEAGSFSGLQMLQEYFCFRPRFWFVDVLGLDESLPASTATSFNLDLHFDRPAPPEARVEPDTLRLHCVPAVNLFEVDAEPIRVHGRAAEYRIVPDVHAPRSVTAYDVRSVVGTAEETGRRHLYRPFYTFPHGAWTAPPPTPSLPTDSSSLASRSSSAPSERHFTTSRRETPHGTPALYLSLGGTERPSLERAGGETLTVGIRATNGSLPRDALSTDALTRLAPGLPRIVRPTNLTRPTPFLRAPDREQFQWSLLAHLAFNFQSVASRDALCHLLRLYDWTASDTRRANRRRIDGIRSVSWTPTTALHHGAVVRGLHLCIEVSESHFPSTGDLCLFGDVLHRFLTAYATINTCVQLSVVGHPSGRSLEWMPTAGTRPPL